MRFRRQFFYFGNPGIINSVIPHSVSSFSPQNGKGLFISSLLLQKLHLSDNNPLNNKARISKGIKVKSLKNASTIKSIERNQPGFDNPPLTSPNNEIVNLISNKKKDAPSSNFLENTKKSSATPKTNLLLPQKVPRVKKLPTIYSGNKKISAKKNSSSAISSSYMLKKTYSPILNSKATRPSSSDFKSDAENILSDQSENNTLSQPPLLSVSDTKETVTEISDAASVPRSSSRSVRMTKGARLVLLDELSPKDMKKSCPTKDSKLVPSVVTTDAPGPIVESQVPNTSKKSYISKLIGENYIPSSSGFKSPLPDVYSEKANIVTGGDNKLSKIENNIAESSRASIKLSPNSSKRLEIQRRIPPINSTQATDLDSGDIFQPNFSLKLNIMANALSTLLWPLKLNTEKMKHLADMMNSSRMQRELMPSSDDIPSGDEKYLLPREIRKKRLRTVLSRNIVDRILSDWDLDYTRIYVRDVTPIFPPINIEPNETPLSDSQFSTTLAKEANNTLNSSYAKEKEAIKLLCQWQEYAKELSKSSEKPLPSDFHTISRVRFNDKSLEDVTVIQPPGRSNTISEAVAAAENLLEKIKNANKSSSLSEENSSNPLFKGQTYHQLRPDVEINLVDRTQDSTSAHLLTPFIEKPILTVIVSHLPRRVSMLGSHDPLNEDSLSSEIIASSLSTSGSDKVFSNNSLIKNKAHLAYMRSMREPCETPKYVTQVMTLVEYIPNDDVDSLEGNSSCDSLNLDESNTTDLGNSNRSSSTSPSTSFGKMVLNSSNEPLSVNEIRTTDQSDVIGLDNVKNKNVELRNIQHVHDITSEIFKQANTLEKNQNSLSNNQDYSDASAGLSASQNSSNTPIRKETTVDEPLCRKHSNLDTASKFSFNVFCQVWDMGPIF